jgi:hypothetical protein
VSQFYGLLLGFNLHGYYLRELLVCWLFFSMLFVSLSLVVLGSVVACYGGKYLTVWARTAAGVTPVVAIGPGKLHLKSISDRRKLKWLFTSS